MCEEEFTLGEEKIKEKENEDIIKIEKVQPKLEENLKNPHKITFGHLGDFAYKAKVINNKHPTKKEEENCLADK